MHPPFRLNKSLISWKCGSSSLPPEHSFFLSALQVCKVSTGLLEFVYGGRTSTLLSVDSRQGCFYLARTGPSRSLHQHQAVHMSLWNWEGSPAQGLDRSDSGFAALCPAALPAHASLWGSCWITQIFRNSCPNESQNKLYHNPVGTVYTNILLFFIKRQFADKSSDSGCLQQKKADRDLKWKKQTTLPL